MPQNEIFGLTCVAEWNVPPDEIDHIDHMGTAFYAYRADQSALHLIERLAASPHGAAFADLVGTVADRHIHYRREQRLGAPLRLTVGVTGAKGSRICFYAEIINAETGEAAAIFNMQVELRRDRLDTPAPVPRAWLEQGAQAWMVPPPGSGPRTLSDERLGQRVSRADFERLGVASHSRQEIRAEACDAAGFLKKTKPKFNPEDHIPQTGAMARVWNYAPGYFWPAVEQRDLRFRVPRRGDVLESYEAVVGVSDKVVHSAVWVFEARSGDLVDVRHMVTVFFAAETRRSENIPAELLRYLKSLAKPELLTIGA